MNKRKNSGNAKIVHETKVSLQNILRDIRDKHYKVIDNEIRFHINLYRESNGQNNSWKLSTMRFGGKLYEAHLTIKERND